MDQTLQEYLLDPWEVGRSYTVSIQELDKNEIVIEL